MIKQYYVYILFSCKDKGLYIGYSSNLLKRFQRHKNGKVMSTKDRRPLKIIHYEVFIDKKDAKSRERYLKSGYGRKQLHQSIKNTLLKCI